MMKDVGSIFPLEDIYSPSLEAPVDSAVSGVVQYSLCREALYDIAVHHRGVNNTVLIPAYTCQSVITPFIEAGWTCHYYNIEKDLRIDVAYLKGLNEQVKPTMIVVHPFYGMSLNDLESEALREIGETGVVIVMDLTHCIYAEPELDFVDYYVGSYRKWFPIPDGAFLKSDRADSHIPAPQKENVEFVTTEADAMFLRGQYFKTGTLPFKTISIRLSKLADHLVDNHIEPHRMSSFSFERMQRQNRQEIMLKRRENYVFLFNHLKQNHNCTFVCPDSNEVSNTPLYFPIFVEKRESLQKALAQSQVYAPILWPLENPDVLISEEIRYIYNHILAIPCDQRYGEEEMERIVCVINDFCQ